MFPTLLITCAVAEVEKLIEEKGVERVMRVEELTLQYRRRRLEKESEEKKLAREGKEESLARRRRFYNH